MAVIFLLLAVAVGVVLGDAAIANTAPGSVELFNQPITDFTQGQLLVAAAALGFLLAVFLMLAWGASRGRRTRRRERRMMHRDMQGQVDDLQHENAELREELDRTRRTTRLSEFGNGSDTPEPVERGQREHVPGDGSIRDRLQRGDRVEEPVRPQR